MRDDLESELKSLELDNEGRFILIDAVVQGSDFVLVNIYEPNKVQKQCPFFSELKKFPKIVTPMRNKKIVLGGDFYVTFDQDLDYSGGNPAKKTSLNCI